MLLRILLNDMVHSFYGMGSLLFFYPIYHSLLGVAHWSLLKREPIHSLFQYDYAFFANTIEYFVQDDSRAVISFSLL
ncbi:hypothetical protein Lqui_1998 [Legionella quinlivanii]|uniref:Uncharacterized protein n=1 Tax=Legionella quinlivanii TaxID=45073 RepID=A0A0W0XU67_9GAMM|nr:hypothetical protein Lqui_1998 [Legionella quinlivanii]SEF99467.1 hypothetical protein SAMN02746093_01617 [Legionella quinlivanii DSM 21216]STY11364.1 Uncharacterised protein [Legionella quinlivanii]